VGKPVYVRRGGKNPGNDMNVARASKPIAKNSEGQAGGQRAFGHWRKEGSNGLKSNWTRKGGPAAEKVILTKALTVR